MANEKKETVVKKAPTAGAEKSKDGKVTKKGGSQALTASALEGLEAAPVPESSPMPGEPGFRWGL